MTRRASDTNGDKSTKRRVHQKPAVQLAALVTLATLLVASTPFVVRADARGIKNETAISSLEKRTVIAIEAINEKLDLLFQPRVAGKP